MVTTCQQMQHAEERLFASGVQAEPLMETAGLGCAEAIRKICPHPGTAILFCGKGNNGGDALVVGRWLKRWGWQVEVEFSHSADQITELAAKKLQEFQAEPQLSISQNSQLILIDGLLGIGATGDLYGPIGELASLLNQLRIEKNAISFAIDIPSGVDGDSGEVYQQALVADHTLSICLPKQGLLADRAINHVGRIHSIELSEICDVEGDSTIGLANRKLLRAWLPRRKFDTHKGQAGRVSIIAGSKGYTGAPILSALGAMHAGAGLITLWVPDSIYSIVAAKAPAEIMVQTYNDLQSVLSSRTDVLAIGPGMVNMVIQESWLEQLIDSGLPMVLDADLLNALAKNPDYLNKLSKTSHILTPHPGEFSRLFPDIAKQNHSRLEMIQQAADKHSITLLLKGARSITYQPNATAIYNSTGTPAMASGGMGDVLTGAIAALIAGGLSSYQAGIVGSWLLGRAAELAYPNVKASRVAEHLVQAKQQIQRY